MSAPRSNYNSLGWTSLAAVLLILISVADYLSGPDISVALFYLIAVALVAWKTRELRLTVVTGVVSAAAWLGAEWFTLGAPTHGILLWNAATRLLILITIGVLISRLRKSLDAEHSMARTDFLTGALNARAFFEKAEIEIARARRYGRPLTVAYLDLDDFKSINDRFGHSHGDTVLQLVAATLMKNLRQTDSVSRLGGDEFVLLLPEIGYDQATGALSKLQQVVCQAMQKEDCSATFSMGAAAFDVPARNVDSLLKVADTIMYEAKVQGKNCIRIRAYSGDGEVSPAMLSGRRRRAPHSDKPSVGR